MDLFIYIFLIYPIVEAFPIANSPSPSLHQICARSTANNTTAIHALGFPPNSPANSLAVFFCNPGASIPPDEAISTLGTAITDILHSVRRVPYDPIPGQAFSKSVLFRPNGDRVTAFVHAVGGAVLLWIDLVQILAEVQMRLQQHPQELHFFVRTDRGEVAVGRVQYVPGQTAGEKN